MSKTGQGLSQQQQQVLRLNTRQMMLSRLLEMSTPEFEEEIVRAMEENPAITTVEASEGDEADAWRDDSYHGHEDEDDNDDDDYLEHGNYHRPVNRRDFPTATSVSSEAEVIEQQLADLSLNDVEREIAHYIIGNLDSSGYLTRTASAIADDMALTAGIAVPTETVSKIVKIVKGLDPAGIGAENLRECLQIQLGRMTNSPVVRLATEILEKHYKAFVNNRLDIVRDSLGIDKDAFEAAIKLIRSLNPKPGAGLFDHEGDERFRHITPDFIIDVDEAGRPTASLAGSIPDLTIDSAFRVENINTTNPKAVDFIKERHDGAEEFIDSVKRRGSTLMSIIKAIMKLQPEFFRSFELHDLRPMVIRDIEELTGLDKSIISRATSSKYMLTPDGMFSLKSLFGESASSSKEIAPREMESAIRKLVDEEDKNDPLSDDDLAILLNSKGLVVARRTVAKYRERMGIPVARLRRKTL